MVATVGTDSRLMVDPQSGKKLINAIERERKCEAGDVLDRRRGSEKSEQREWCKAPRVETKKGIIKYGHGPDVSYPGKKAPLSMLRWLPSAHGAPSRARKLNAKDNASPMKKNISLCGIVGIPSLGKH
ncbi:hypothetical protein FCM35_KLT09897 [Carex littledalei]|uniref:Uncharacterized protein n=1 Tax=Carex littledalei TaxID=544730 RepID=A0A833VYK9_9POAL|nr:hypothetical protein FCM35_KLT09897 [Carex littledalei]